MRRAPLWVVLVIGIGLAAAPAIFGMFTRAPAGGRMLDAFEPFMQAEVIDSFGAYLSQVDAAATELAPRPEASSLPPLAAFLGAWGGIEADMRGMLATIEANFDNYEAVAALPPFALFPWFFVIPGLLLAGLAWRGLVIARGTDQTAGRGIRVALALLGAGLFAAPLMFSMYSRAPLGGEMIDDFTPLMTTERITEVQHYFLVMAGGEGAVRTRLLPALREAGADEATLAAELPATLRFIEVWPQMSREMAPMMGTMSDQLDSFAGIAAMPPFPLFPWFFAVPGVAVAALALAAGRPVPARKTEVVPAA